VYSTFLQRCSASKVLQFFRAQQLRLPRRGRFGEVVWKVPTLTAILGILKNPAYAGAFVYGRTRTQRVSAASRRASHKHLPWRSGGSGSTISTQPIFVETYEQIRASLQDNYAEYDRTKTRGIPRPGAALVQGLGYCGALWA